MKLKIVFASFVIFGFSPSILCMDEPRVITLVSSDGQSFEVPRETAIRESETLKGVVAGSTETVIPLSEISSQDLKIVADSLNLAASRPKYKEATQGEIDAWKTRERELDGRIEAMNFADLLGLLKAFNYLNLDIHPVVSIITSRIPQNIRLVAAALFLLDEAKSKKENVPQPSEQDKADLTGQWLSRDEIARLIPDLKSSLWQSVFYDQYHNLKNILETEEAMRNYEKAESAKYWTESDEE